MIESILSYSIYTSLFTNKTLIYIYSNYPRVTVSRWRNKCYVIRGFLVVGEPSLKTHCTVYCTYTVRRILYASFFSRRILLCMFSSI